MKTKRLHIDNNKGSETDFDGVAVDFLQALIFDGYDRVIITVEDGNDIDEHTIYSGEYVTVRRVL